MNIFVFGSNLLGHHGAGAALYAAKTKGARRGVGEGLTGHSYALPTKNENIETRPLADIKESVDKFIKHAVTDTENTYEITHVGAGLAGYDWVTEIHPMFPYPLPENCYFIDEAGNKENDTRTA